MIFQNKGVGIVWILMILFGCQSKKLEQVSVADFQAFVEATNYVTDAEKFDWSIVQQDVYRFDVVFGVHWRCPDGQVHARADYPVTQVSYQDALAYCAWSKTRLPSYQEYWKYASADTRPIIENMPQIVPISQANIVGNVWELTTTPRTNGVIKEIRLAGGSYLCNKNTCNGVNPQRVLYVDEMTGNTHIGFSVWR